MFSVELIPCDLVFELELATSTLLPVAIIMPLILLPHPVAQWYQGWKNISLSILNACVFVIGIIILGCGTYASVQDIINQYTGNSVRGAFTCDSSSYT